MLEWLKSVVSDPDILSAVRVTFTMAVCSTGIASVLGSPSVLCRNGSGFRERRS